MGGGRAANRATEESRPNKDCNSCGDNGHISNGVGSNANVSRRGGDGRQEKWVVGAIDRSNGKRQERSGEWGEG